MSWERRKRNAQKKQGVPLGVPFNKTQSSLSSQGGASRLEPARRKGKPSHLLPVAASLRGRPLRWCFLYAALVLLLRITTIPHFLTSLNVYRALSHLPLFPLPFHRCGGQGFGLPSSFYNIKQLANIMGSFSSLYFLFSRFSTAKNHFAKFFLCLSSGFWARSYLKNFIDIESFTAHTNSNRKLLWLLSFYRWHRWGTVIRLKLRQVGSRTNTFTCCARLHVQGRTLVTPAKQKDETYTFFKIIIPTLRYKLLLTFGR